MADKKNVNNFNFDENDEFDFNDYEHFSFEDDKPTITEQDIRTANNLRENVIKRQIVGNEELTDMLNEEKVTDEEILDTMTYYVAIYAERLGCKRTIFKRFMEIAREVDSLGNKNVGAMISFFADLINDISQGNFGHDLDEKKNEYIQIYASVILFLIENKNWK